MLPRVLLLFFALVLVPASGLAQSRPRRAQAGAAGAGRRPVAPPAGRAPRAKAALDPGQRSGPRSLEPRPGARTGAPRERPGSVGHPNEGRLEGGVHLDTSRPYVRVVPAYARGDVRWGLPALIGMLDRAARGVAKKHPGAVLGVGDISRKGGGEVMRHHSHESGRDVDLAFYVVDAKGKPVQGHAFIGFDESLTAASPPGARFDLARNWLLVQLMLTDPAAQVSHIFVAEPLRQRLLAHARSIGVSQRLLDRAAIAMMQPTNALPHDDHFHVRISCPRSMRGTCIEIAKGGIRPRPRGGSARPALRTPGRTPREGVEPTRPDRISLGGARPPP